MNDFHDIEKLSWVKPGEMCYCDGEGVDVHVIVDWPAGNYVLINKRDDGMNRKYAWKEHVTKLHPVTSIVDDARGWW